MQPFTLKNLVLYFLKLGATGFGGPVALVGYMLKDLVEEKKWFSKEDYQHGLALAQIVPGPIAAQLAIYFGYLKAGTLGATLIGIAFILPPFLIVWILSYFYILYQGLPWIHAVFYGMSAVIIGIIAQAAYKLAKTCLGRQKGLWGIFFVLAGTTMLTQKASLLFFLLAGLMGIILYAPPRFCRLRSIIPLDLFVFFFKSAIVVYGSGMAIIPFIYGDVVHRFGWINDQQFLDAMAVGMITPGPVLITVGFIGYLVDGLRGQIASVVGIFMPVWLFVVVCAPWFRRIVQNEKVKAFVRGVTAAAAGAIAGSVYILGRKAIIDPWTALLAVTSLYLVLKTKIPAPVIILAGGAVGWLIKTVI